MTRADDMPWNARRAYALQLRLWREQCGNPPLPVIQKLAAELGHDYPDGAVHDRLATGRELDWTFVETVLLACHRAAGEEPELDLPHWRRAFDRLRRVPDRTVSVGPVPAVADAYQRRSVLVGDAPGRTFVLTGRGGVGKTQIAAALARRWPDLVVWATAGSRAEIVATFAEAARTLGVGEDAEQLPAHLAVRDGRPWLVVLDDLRDPGDLDGLWPPAGNGITVVTTRRPEPEMRGDGRTMVPVGVFTASEARRYLTDRLGSDVDGADELAARLGHLPLALAQAAAVILDRRLDCRAYLARLLDDRASALSIDAADAREPAGVARPLLEIAARLDAGGVPLDLFTAGPLRELVTARRGAPTTTDDLANGLANLELMSLCRIDRHRRTVQVHRLVREDEPDRTGDLVWCAADGLLETWPDAGPVDVPRRNVQALLAADAEALCRRRLHPVVFRAGNSLPLQGLFAASADYWSGLLPVVERCLGPEHEDTLTVRNNLAWAHGRTGDAARALAELRALLPIRTRVLGADDANTLATRHGIAVWLFDAGEPDQAVRLMRELAGDYERVLGPDARDTVNTRIALAGYLGQTESPGVAAAQLSILLDQFRRVPGVDEHELLDAEYNLIGWLAEAGELDDALPRADRLIEDYRRVVGPDHVDTLWARLLAAMLLAQTGRRASAAAALRVLADDVRRIEEAGDGDVAAVQQAIDQWSTTDEDT